MAFQWNNDGAKLLFIARESTGTKKNIMSMKKSRTYTTITD